jgi:hypothetical protein
MTRGEGDADQAEHGDGAVRADVQAEVCRPLAVRKPSLVDTENVEYTLPVLLRAAIQPTWMPTMTGERRDGGEEPTWRWRWS